MAIADEHKDKSGQYFDNDSGAYAKLINQVKPLGIVPTTLNANEGTQLEKDILWLKSVKF